MDDKGGTKSLPMTEAFKSKREKDMDAAEGKKRDQSGQLAIPLLACDCAALDLRRAHYWLR